MHTIEIYCDGAVSGNGKDNSVGGYAYVVVEDGIAIKEFGVGERNTTNQRMELKAVIASLEECKNRGCFSSFPDSSFGIFSDSAYVINCINQKWYTKWRANGWLTSKNQPVANQDLWEKILPYLDCHAIKFYKVKGHTGNNDYNAIADSLAVSYRLAAAL